MPACMHEYTYIYTYIYNIASYEINKRMKNTMIMVTVVTMDHRLPN